MGYWTLCSNYTAHAALAPVSHPSSPPPFRLPKQAVRASAASVQWTAVPARTSTNQFQPVLAARQLHASAVGKLITPASPSFLRFFILFSSFPLLFKSSACSCLSLLFVMKCTLSCFTEHASSYLLSCSAFYGACLWQPLPLQHAVLCETRITKSTQVRP